jgi:hypothetical protein
MPIEVRETALAAIQGEGLRGRPRKAYAAFLDDLASRGCAALTYRVTGPHPLPQLCVKHLRGQDRVVVAFENGGLAWVVLVGPHADTDPARNVYDSLYQLVGVQPPSDQRRAKPGCCDATTGRPPITELGEIDELVRRARAIARGRP